MSLRAVPGEREGAAVVIIGGGVTGLSAGWWLAREGVDTLVIEAGAAGWGATAAAARIITVRFFGKSSVSGR